MMEKEWETDWVQFLNQFKMSKDNLTESGFELETSGLTYQHSAK